MHKDLSDLCRAIVEGMAEGLAEAMMDKGQSLALAREAWIAAFDAAAEKLDAQ